MPTKAAVAKSWTLVASYDSRRYSKWPAGDKPSGFQTTPTLVFTDIVAGSTTGGDGGNGHFLTLYGYNFGRFSDIGTASGARVYIGGVEVANYRCMGLAPTYAYNQLEFITVQVGALAGQTGALDVKMVVGGVDTNTLTAGFYVQPGRQAFVSLTGSDATGVFNDSTKPFRYVQDYAGGTGSPVAGSLWAATTAHGEAGLRAGDQIVMGGGAWGDMVGYDANFLRFKDKTGTVPNGVAGQGYISLTRDPGSVGANAPATVVFTSPAGTVNKGCIQGCGGANALAGYGRYFTVSGIQIKGLATSGVGGLVNFQSGANKWRVVGCELGPWPSTADARVGGCAGNGDGIKALGNYIHDIEADPAPGNLNHGIYFDGSNSSGWDACASNCEAAYNAIINILNGSGFQTFNQDSSGVLTGISFHHNWIKTTAKYGVNMGSSTRSIDVYNNVIQGCGVAPFRWDTLPTSIAINVTHNTCRHVGTQYALVINTGGNTTSGAIKYQHNTFVIGAGSTSGLNYVSVNAGDSALTIKRNLYFDENTVKTDVPSQDGDATYPGLYGDPAFTSVALQDFTCGASGAGRALCTDAELIAVATDFYGIARPVTGTGAPGVTKNDIGAMQGTGT